MKKWYRMGKWMLLFSLLSILWKTDVSAADFFYPPDTDDELVIVLDPGHGGKNLGANYDGFLEKEMNMIVADAMYEELSKYEGVTVYMTHTSMDDDMEIQSRADFAASVNADFLFCLHFNMSADNNLFGSEVWISNSGEENRQGYRFGQFQMDAMQEMGLFLRGIKTRLNDRGTDYYGILRFCEEYGIPAALIEHAHIDHEEDVPFCDSMEELQAFGVADATAVAKFFGLKSEELQVDYSFYADAYPIKAGAQYAKEDKTDPDICMIEEGYVDLEHYRAGIQVTGCDYDSPMLYYSYSIDGGLTYSPYIPWPDTDVMAGTSTDTFLLEVDIPEGVSPSFKVRGINQYNCITESNLLAGYPFFTGVPKEEPTPKTEPTVPVVNEDVSTGNGGFKPHERTKTPDKEDYSSFFLLCILITGVLLVTFFITNFILASKKRQKRRRKKRR